MLLENHWSAEFKIALCRNPPMCSKGSCDLVEKFHCRPGVFSVSSLCKTELVVEGTVRCPGLADQGITVSLWGVRVSGAKTQYELGSQAPVHMRCVLGCVSVSVFACVFACVYNLYIYNHSKSELCLLVLVQYQTLTVHRPILQCNDP